MQSQLLGDHCMICHILYKCCLETASIQALNESDELQVYLQQNCRRGVTRLKHASKQLIVKALIECDKLLVYALNKSSDSL